MLRRCTAGMRGCIVLYCEDVLQGCEGVLYCIARVHCIVLYCIMRACSDLPAARSRTVEVR